MAKDLNKFQCIGRLGQAPEIKYLQSGSAVCNFSVALGESWKDKQTGQKQERTEWVRFVAFDKLAEIMGEYLDKGSLVYLEGRLRTRSYKAQDGSDRYVTEVVAENMQMLGGNSGASNQNQAPQQNNQRQPQGSYQQQPANQPPGNDGAGMDQGPDDWSDDIPF